MFSLTNYLKFKNIELEELIPYRFTRISFSKYEKKRPTIYKLIHLLKVRCIKYITHFFFQDFVNKI